MDRRTDGGVNSIPITFLKIAIRGDGKSPDQTAISKFSVFQSISCTYILNESKVKRCKDSMKCDIISENKNRCTVNDFIFACSFFLCVCQNHLIIIFDVIICTGYTIFANILHL